MKERDKYLKLVEWSEEDQCYIGSIPGWIGQCCHGAEEEKVYQELCQIADEWRGEMPLNYNTHCICNLR